MSGNGLLLLLVIGLVLWLKSKNKRGRVVGRLDKGSDRWGISVHEAGHYHAARKLGGRSPRAYVKKGSGWANANWPDSIPPDSIAVFLLAGGAAGRKVHSTYGPSAHDKHQARRYLTGTGMSYGQAQRRADRIVNSQWGAIQSTAHKLHDRGRV